MIYHETVLSKKAPFGAFFYTTFCVLSLLNTTITCSVRVSKYESFFLVFVQYNNLILAQFATKSALHAVCYFG